MIPRTLIYERPDTVSTVNPNESVTQYQLTALAGIKDYRIEFASDIFDLFDTEPSDQLFPTTDPTQPPPGTVDPILNSYYNNPSFSSIINTITNTTNIVAGVKVIQLICVDFTTNTATGDGKAYCHIPASLNGMNLIRVHARVITAGTTNTTDVQIANVTDAVDMLSTKLTIDSTETGSNTAATPAVVDTTKDDVATNDVLRIDVDAVSTTPAKGLIVTMEFQLP